MLLLAIVVNPMQIVMALLVARVPLAVVSIRQILAVAFLLEAVALINATLEPMTFVVILVLVHLDKPAVAMSVVIQDLIVLATELVEVLPLLSLSIV